MYLERSKPLIHTSYISQFNGSCFTSGVCKDAIAIVIPLHDVGVVTFGRDLGNSDLIVDRLWQKYPKVHLPEHGSLVEAGENSSCVVGAVKVCAILEGG